MRDPKLAHILVNVCTQRRDLFPRCVCTQERDPFPCCVCTQGRDPFPCCVCTQGRDPITCCVCTQGRGSFPCCVCTQGRDPFPCRVYQLFLVPSYKSCDLFVNQSLHNHRNVPAAADVHRFSFINYTVLVHTTYSGYRVNNLSLHTDPCTLHTAHSAG